MSLSAHFEMLHGGQYGILWGEPYKIYMYVQYIYIYIYIIVLATCHPLLY